MKNSYVGIFDRNGIKNFEVACWKIKQRKFREKNRRFRNRENMRWAWPFVVTSKSNKASTWFWSVGRVLMSFSADICRKVPCSFLKLKKEIQWLILNQINNFNIRYPVEPCISNMTISDLIVLTQGVVHKLRLQEELGRPTGCICF